MERFRDGILNTLQPIQPPIFSLREIPDSHRVHSRFGVKIDVRKRENDHIDEDLKFVIPAETNLGRIEISPFGTESAEDLFSNSYRSHAMLSAIYGLVDCLGAYDNPDKPGYVEAPELLYGVTHYRMARLGERLGFSVGDKTYLDYGEKNVPGYLIVGERIEVQERAREFIVNLPEPIYERLDEEAQASFPGFWEDPVSEAHFHPLVQPHISFAFALLSDEERQRRIRNLQRTTDALRWATRGVYAWNCYSGITALKEGRYDDAAIAALITGIGVGLEIKTSRRASKNQANQ